MAQAEPVCACGRQAIDVLRVASEDGLLLLAVCAECAEDPIAGEQGQLFGPSVQRRPMAIGRARENDEQPCLPLDDLAQENDAA